MKIATTTADFEQYVPFQTDICEILPMMAESGFRNIDFNMYQMEQTKDCPLLKEDWQWWVDGIQNTAVRLGLDFVQAHGSDGIFEDGLEKDARIVLIRRQLEVCRMLGIPGITIHAVSKNHATRQEFMEGNTRFYGEILRTAEETGVCVYTENSCKTNNPFYYLLCADDLNELRERLHDHNLFGFCYDVGHANAEHADFYREILAMKEGLKAVHIHDNLGTDIHAQPYSGNCSYDAIVKGLKDAGYHGYFTMEAYSLPSPAGFMGRKSLVLDGICYDRLISLPLSLKIRSERLMFDTVRHMLSVYDCLEE